jgi:heme/copper-type cytochrome/quinol oxidase subunit 2
MIPWLARGMTNTWLRVAVTLFIFGWLIYIAWRENRHYRDMSVIVTRQFEVLRADHARAEFALKALAGQVSKSTEAVKKLPDELK